MSSKKRSGWTNVAPKKGNFRHVSIVTQLQDEGEKFSVCIFLFRREVIKVSKDPTLLFFSAPSLATEHSTSIALHPFRFRRLIQKSSKKKEGRQRNGEAEHTAISSTAHIYWIYCTDDLINFTQKQPNVYCTVYCVVLWEKKIYL